MKTFFLSFFLLLAFISHAQEQTEVTKSSTSYPKVIESTDKFSSIGVSSFIDFIFSPLSYGKMINGNNFDPNNPNVAIPNYVTVPVQTQTVSFFTIIYEYRKNVIEFSENFALAASTSPSLALSQTFPTEETQGQFGFGTLQVPVQGKLYLGGFSTKESTGKFGVSVGAGMEFVKMGIIPFRSQKIEGDDFPNPAWVMPTYSLGVHFYRYNNPMEFNIKYGQGKTESYNLDKFGNRTIAKKYTSAQSLRLSLLYLF